MPGRTGAAASDLSELGRDGTWVTSQDNSGLSMVYGGKFVRGGDGKPLTVPWAALAARGRGDFRQALDSAPTAPQ